RIRRRNNSTRSDARADVFMLPPRPKRSSGHGIAGIRAKAAHICGVAYTPEGLVDVFAKQRELAIFFGMRDQDFHPSSLQRAPHFIADAVVGENACDLVEMRDPEDCLRLELGGVDEDIDGSGRV
ncbi:hypothetical protein OY671_008637, partial [Metschnikowia pulcherrima]